MTGLLPWLVVALVAFVVLKVVLGAIKTSAKLMMWVVVAIALGAGFLWYQNQDSSQRPSLPSLSIPSGEPSQLR